jgi:hypothetical protein
MLWAGPSTEPNGRVPGQGACMSRGLLDDGPQMPNLLETRCGVMNSRDLGQVLAHDAPLPHNVN